MRACTNLVVLLQTVTLTLTLVQVDVVPPQLVVLAMVLPEIVKSLVAVEAPTRLAVGVAALAAVEIAIGVDLAVDSVTTGALESHFSESDIWRSSGDSHPCVLHSEQSPKHRDSDPLWHF